MTQYTKSSLVHTYVQMDNWALGGHARPFAIAFTTIAIIIAFIIEETPYN